MKFARDWNRPVQANVSWQAGVAPDYPCLATASYRWVEVNYLEKGVHTGVGSPGALHAYGLVGDRGKGAFERILHGQYAREGLRLPTVEAATGVLDTAGQTRANRQ
jgi:hypothetical protein